MNTLRVFTVLLFVCTSFVVREVRAHGYLAVPAPRNSLHLVYNVNPCPAPNSCEVVCPYQACGKVNADGGAGTNMNGLSSGGPAWVYAYEFCHGCNRACGCTGRHTMCGDNPTSGQGEKHREGGIYSTGNINGVYVEEQNISINLIITANHCGHHEFVLYNIPDNSDFRTPYNETTYPSFKLHQAVVEPTKIYSLYHQTPGNPPNLAHVTIDPETQWVLPNQECHSDMYLTQRSYYLKYRLPKGITCKRCVLQWHWVTANQGSVNVDPEEFWNCVDITILQRGSSGRLINAKDFPFPYTPTGALSELKPPVTTSASTSTTLWPTISTTGPRPTTSTTGIRPTTSTTGVRPTTGVSTTTSASTGGHCAYIYRTEYLLEKWDTGARWNVTFTNSGTEDVQIRFLLAPKPANGGVWEVWEDYDGSYILPNWLDPPYTLAAGRSHVWGYVSAGTSPYDFKFLTPGEC